VSVPSVLAVLTLALGVPLNLYVTAKLWRLSSASGNAVLRERTLNAVFVLVLVAVFGVIFVNNDLVPPPLAFETTKYLTRAVMLLVALIPALYWLRLYRHAGPPEPTSYGGDRPYPGEGDH
jgi:hypothetical protein